MISGTVEEIVRIDDTVNWVVSLGAETYTIDDMMTKLNNIEDVTDDLIDIEKGNWVINTSSKQMIFYRQDGTELMRFNLYDEFGNLSTNNVYRREKV